LVPAGFIGGEFFAASDSGEFFSSNRNAKRCFARTNQLYDAKKQKPDKEDFVHSQFTIVGQTSGGMGASQSTAYKSEINVKMVELTSVMNLQMFTLQKPNVN
jgi:HAE1 family hydrophobic/amphiphilic exporter-1